MHTTVLLFTCALAVAAATPQFPLQSNYADLLTTPRPPYIPIISRNEVRDDSGQVISTYQSADGTSFEQVDVLKPGLHPNKPKVIVQQGTYSYISPDGTPVQVSYIADEKGFRPVGTHILSEVPTVPDVPEVEPIPVPATQPPSARASVLEPLPVSFPAPPPALAPVPVSFPAPPRVPAPAPLSFPAPPPVPAPAPLSFPAPPPAPAPAPLSVSFPAPPPAPAPTPFPAPASQPLGSAPVPAVTNSGVPSVPGASSFSPFPSVPGAPAGTFVQSPTSPSGYIRLF